MGMDPISLKNHKMIVYHKIHILHEVVKMHLYHIIFLLKEGQNGKIYQVNIMYSYW